MRYVALALTVVLLMFATLVAAGWWPAWSATDVHLYVGEKVRVRVTPTWSGLVDYANGVHWTFASDNPAVATGTVRLDSALPQEFDITGVAPGIAHIRLDGGGWPYVTIRVACPPENFAIAAQPVVQAALGRESISWLSRSTKAVRPSAGTSEVGRHIASTRPQQRRGHPHGRFL